MSTEPVQCPDCGAGIETTDDVEHEHEVADLELDDAVDPPRVILGAGTKDLWRCKSCGRVLGVS
ncbi:hypothetical protein [Haloprofundus salilacus]|uniref:hypothetical protein n=1 Tax=Haloprofundus salilacus TaxID=2876190 RepID=UPI001CCBE7DB|nr:hypothetical protein [Haloprofundus salilacus]